MRFWDVSSGAIEVSGYDVRRVATASLRQVEGFMTQETHLFAGTVRDNLVFAKPGASDKEIMAACEKASIADFVRRLPSGLDTQVGELGDALSGGERQRLGLARMFLHDAPFVLLDGSHEQPGCPERGRRAAGARRQSSGEDGAACEPSSKRRRHR